MKKIILLLTIVLSARSGFSQQLNGVKIDSLVERAMSAFHVPGIAVAVIQDGHIIHSKGYGVRSLATRQPVDEMTAFGIGSNSKAFTAAAIAMLVDAGKLGWDDKVIKFIPEFRMYDPYVSKEMTIRDLLSHHSGLGQGEGDLMLFPDSADFTVKDVLYNLRFLKPVYGFRTRFGYSNLLYAVAGEIVARVSGMSYEYFIKQRIMQPLGMNHSAAAFGHLKNNNVIDGHEPVNGTISVVPRNTLKAAHAAGGLYASLADLEEWVKVQLAGGKYGEKLSNTLFSASVHKEMWSPQTIMPVGGPGPYNTHFAAYGMGFEIYDITGGNTQIRHSGEIDGMMSQITMIPQLKLGIIILTNQEAPGAMITIANGIKDGYLGISGKDRLADNLATERKDRLADSAANAAAEKLILNAMTVKIKAGYQKYTGDYKDDWFGKVSIRKEKDGVYFISHRSAQLTGKLYPYGKDTLAVRWKNRQLQADAFVLLKVDHKNRVIGFTMKAISPATDFSYDFQDLDFKRQVPKK